MEIITQLLEQYKQNTDMKLDLYDNISRSLATQSAIKSGKTLAMNEMQLLIDELFACEVPYAGPGGRKTFINIDMHELNKRFE